MKQFNQPFTPFAAIQMNLRQIRVDRTIQKFAAGIFLIFLSLAAQAQAPFALPDGETGKSYIRSFTVSSAGGAGAAQPQVLMFLDGAGQLLVTRNPAGTPTLDAAGNMTPVLTTIVNGITVTIMGLTVNLNGTPTTAGSHVLRIRAATGARVGDSYDTFSFKLNVAPSFKVDFPAMPGAQVAPAVPCAVLGPVGAPLPKSKNGSDDLTFHVANSFDPCKIDVNDKYGIDGNGKISDATVLIDSLLGRAEDLAAIKADEGYCIVQVVKWRKAMAKADGKVTTQPDKYETESDNWQLYQFKKDKWEVSEEESTDRVYGKKSIAALVIHLNTKPGWDISYSVKVNKRVPAPIQNALELVSFLGSAKGDKAGEDTPLNLWGGRILTIKDTPSDVIVSGKTVFANPDAISGPTQQASTHSKTYLNEGRYWWDVSLGMPVTGVKEVTYSIADDAAQNGRVTASEVSRQNAFGFLNLYLQPRDLQSSKPQKLPHLVFGVPISKKPLDRPLIGLGYGFSKQAFKVNLFAGVVFNRVREPRTLQVGDMAGPSQLEADFRTRRIRKFVFGINFPVRDFIKAIKK